MFSFLSLINNSVTIGLIFCDSAYTQQSYHQILSKCYVLYLDCIDQYFHKYHPYGLNVK